MRGIAEYRVLFFVFCNTSQTAGDRVLFHVFCNTSHVYIIYRVTSPLDEMRELNET